MTVKPVRNGARERLRCFDAIVSRERELGMTRYSRDDAERAHAGKSVADLHKVIAELEAYVHIQATQTIGVAS